MKTKHFPRPLLNSHANNILRISTFRIVHAPDPDLMDIFRFSVNN